MIKGEDNNMLERPVVKIAPDTYLVSEYKLVNMFLVVGKHRAALIDTGGGIGPLPYRASPRCDCDTRRPGPCGRRGPFPACVSPPSGLGTQPPFPAEQYDAQMVCENAGAGAQPGQREENRCAGAPAGASAARVFAFG